MKSLSIEELISVGQDLELINNNDMARLSEKIFANVFVPLFAGEESIYGATLDTWISYAGSPYASVAIVDAQGKELFIVPPLYDRSYINTEVNRKVSISHIVVTAQQFARIHPNQGSAYMNNELSKKAMLLKNDDALDESLKFWNMVFKRYGKPEIVKSAIVDEKITSSTLPLSEDMFEDL